MPSKAIITMPQHKVPLIIYSYSILKVESHCPPSYEKGYIFNCTVTLIHNMAGPLQQPVIITEVYELML